ncbi:MAG: gluconate 2-dehydrogenase subunit 3 family protein [Chloroflexi bacterium]|nr:gluconate 2-dehydrogenase subunit 3 family protein [Chloroflexota bacterium]
MTKDTSEPTPELREWTRRQFLARSLAVTGGLMLSYLLGKVGWHEWKVHSVHPPRRRRPGKVLTEHEYATLVALADLIVPSDELGPGARDVAAADTIEQWLMRDSLHLERYRQGLLWLDQASAQVYGPGTYFIHLTPAQQIALLEEADRVFQEIRRPAPSLLDRAWRYWDKLVVTLFGLGKGVTFLHLVRDDVLEAVYSHPKTWIPLGYDGPPQPLGYWNGAHGDWNIIDDCPPTKRKDFWEKAKS